MENTEFRYQWKNEWYYIDFAKNKAIPFKLYENRNKTTPLEQFTGVSDNDNYKLFEGDIVEYEDYLQPHEDFFKNMGVVCFSSEGVSFSNRESVDMEDIDWGEVYIIGNIHDTPELNPNQ